LVEIKLGELREGVCSILCMYACICMNDSATPQGSEAFDFYHCGRSCDFGSVLVHIADLILEDGTKRGEGKVLKRDTPVIEKTRDFKSTAFVHFC